MHVTPLRFSSREHSILLWGSPYRGVSEEIEGRPPWKPPSSCTCPARAMVARRRSHRTTASCLPRSPRQDAARPRCSVSHPRRSPRPATFLFAMGLEANKRGRRRNSPSLRRRRRREGGSEMEAALRGIRGKLTEHREKVISALLLGSFVVLGWRSSEQQREIDGLMAEKHSLRATNASMSAAMWAWREELFSLAAKPSSPISLSRLRDIYGEEEPALPPSNLPGSDAGEESVTIA